MNSLKNPINLHTITNQFAEKEMEKIDEEMNTWRKSNLQVFWGEIAPCDHLVQVYESDAVFLNTLEGFVGDGFMKGESVVIIATSEHLDHLNGRLTRHGFDLEALIATDQYIPVDVEESIAAFMVNNWPDELLFTEFVTSLLARGQKNNRKVRAFGEIVAVLWAQGLSGATVKLEHLWHHLQQKQLFCLYCAYPRSGFTQDARDSIANICDSHTKVIDGGNRPSTEIYYRASIA